MADGTTPIEASQNGPLADGATPPLAERLLEALGELVDIGLKIARAIGRQVDDAAPGSAPIADLDVAALAYSRVARAVRQTILLQSKLTERLQIERKTAAAKAGVRARVAGVIRQAIEAEHDDEEAVERIAAEAAERLELEDFDEVLALPLREIIAAICKDLGLSPDWQGLEEGISSAEDFARRALGRGEAGDPPEPDGPLEVWWLDAEGRPVPASKCNSS